MTSVEPGSPAAEAGLVVGDVITEINRQPVRNAEDAVRLTTKPSSRVTLLHLWSKGRSHFLVVDESKETKE